jgi:hypothetical protein
MRFVEEISLMADIQKLRLDGIDDGNYPNAKM